MKEIFRKKYETPSVALQNMAGIPVEWICHMQSKIHWNEKNAADYFERNKKNSAIIRIGQEQNENVECMSF